ncbi:2,3-bisphosphoglycerate-dependent phosphoglycerate mutase [Candidatus Daviesbacteria bacterium]|nr:2,3-bisphosphoglycerate-dependent phosphoglycerate mutase [Candidatus Daviesbacteria bacterium]
MSYLILVRHGKSQWNELGLWTGLEDVPLSQQGRKDAKNAAWQLLDIKIDHVFVSALIRSIKTFEAIKDTLNLNVPITQDLALDERDYGIYTGKNKWEIEKQVGEEEFEKIRRGWDYPIPDGETMKDVYKRIVPYYEKKILPLLKSDKNILVVSHGNALRALEKYLDNLTEEQFMELEFGIGEVHIYKIDKEGKVLSKEIRAENPDKGKI